MSRFINPVPQYLDGNGDPVCFGKLYYYEAGTNTLKNTYNDVLLTVANTNPVELDAAGRVPSIFYNGSARVVLKDCNNQLVWDKSPVGGQIDFSDFSEYSESVIYSINDIAEKNSVFYRSLTNDNQGNAPDATPASNANWVKIGFIEDYNSTISYQIGSVTKTASGGLWRSTASANINHNPDTDDGTNWIPCVAGAKIPELIAIESRTTTSIVHTGGGILTALRVNELQDSSAYSLPLASSVAANQWIDIEIIDEYSAQQPTIQRTGADTITWRIGSDTSILFDSAVSLALRLYSDGISEWRL
jgi:hypothetical protein